MKKHGNPCFIHYLFLIVIPIFLSTLESFFLAIGLALAAPASKTSSK